VCQRLRLHTHSCSHVVLFSLGLWSPVAPLFPFNAHALSLSSCVARALLILRLVHATARLSDCTLARSCTAYPPPSLWQARQEAERKKKRPPTYAYGFHAQSGRVRHVYAPTPHLCLLPAPIGIEEEWRVHVRGDPFTVVQPRSNAPHRKGSGVALSPSGTVLNKNNVDHEPINLFHRN